MLIRYGFVLPYATVLFLDIASSTERTIALGDAAWRNLLNAYYSIIRKELARFRGKETNTAGDGLLATFDGPARAIRCAIAISRGVKQLGIDVRAGVHTGECEIMGHNVGGIAVNIGARIMSNAKPGSVLSLGNGEGSCGGLRHRVHGHGKPCVERRSWRVEAFRRAILIEINTPQT